MLLYSAIPPSEYAPTLLVMPLTQLSCQTEPHIAARRDRRGSHSDQPRPGRRRGCKGDTLDRFVEIPEVNGAGSSGLLARFDDALLSAAIWPKPRRAA